MKELFRSNDPVLLSYVDAVLSDAGIAHDIVDANMSIMEGSLGVLPRRMLVGDDDFLQAQRVLIEADLSHVIRSD